MHEEGAETESENRQSCADHYHRAREREDYGHAQRAGEAAHCQRQAQQQKLSLCFGNPACSGTLTCFHPADRPFWRSAPLTNRHLVYLNDQSQGVIDRVVVRKSVGNIGSKQHQICAGAIAFCVFAPDTAF